MSSAVPEVCGGVISSGIANESAVCIQYPGTDYEYSVDISTAYCCAAVCAVVVCCCTTNAMIY